MDNIPNSYSTFLLACSNNCSCYNLDNSLQVPYVNEQTAQTASFFYRCLEIYIRNLNYKSTTRLYVLQDKE